MNKGIKTFEIRKNDRSFRVGDILELLECDKVTDQLTDRKCTRVITYIVEGGQFGLEKDYVIMGIEPISYYPNLICLIKNPLFIPLVIGEIYHQLSW